MFPEVEATDWEDLWIELSEIRNITPKKHVAIHDSLGWYRQTWVLGRKGWILESIGDYVNERDECLINDKYCLYEYIDRD